MTRLIDVDALKEKIIDLLEIEWGYEGIREDVSRIIDSMPTTEERPITLESSIDYLTEIGWLPEHDRILTDRPYGEWVKTTSGDYECFNCKSPTSDEFPYCPWCGASMMKEGERE